MPRINLLKDEEIKLFDTLPKFSEEERKQYFIHPDKNEVEFRKIYTKIGYILQQGYFLSQNKFFLPEQFYESDIEYVTKLCGVERKLEFKSNYSLAVSYYHKQVILEKFGYSLFSKNTNLFEKEAQELVKSPLRPKEIFYALLDFLDERKIERPRYYVFAEVITNSLNHFEKNLIHIINENLTENQKEILDEFMKLSLNPDQELSSKNPYLLTHLKKVIQATTPGKIHQSLTDFYIVQDLHKNLSEFFKSELISQELINYYAVWVIKAEYVQFERIRDLNSKRLYVVSFISYQYKIRQDYFVDTFLQLIQKYYNDTEKSTAQSFMSQDVKVNKQQEQKLKIENIAYKPYEKLNRIQKISSLENHDDSYKIVMIREVLSDYKGEFFEILSQELEELMTTNIKNFKEQLFYDELTKNYRKIQNRIGGILLVLEFNPQTSNLEIYQAVNYYQQKKGKMGNRYLQTF